MQKQKRGSREKGIEFQSKQDFRIKEVFGGENGHREMMFEKHNKMFHFAMEGDEVLVKVGTEKL